ncbi:hypothetical protein JZ751_006202 [Albula glossodonta]|uniref:Protein N-terminal asparagine amidohydrolase n=1 Tax=Albula glossodonta TaxID=121402 RepID=A0A8T2N3F8_9TELE|nr:hypothetical protein JZ751_006202 [Albula glossodonta]
MKNRFLTATPEKGGFDSALNEHARAFRSKALVNVEHKCLLYVQQREFAATTPADNSVTVIGSDDATTCHLVVVRHSGSGATCLAHCDGSNTWAEVPQLVKAVTSLSSQAKEGRLELHLIGGFDDESKTSQSLSLSLLELNDIVTDGIHRPVVYGVGVNVKTGEVFPASLPTRGPAEELRSARTFTGGQMVDIYDSGKQQVKYLSTSPQAEPPHFVQHMKTTIQFLLDHPSPDSLFPGGRPQLFRRTEQGSWDRVPQQ